MENTAHRAIAIVGIGAVLPDAPNVNSFWTNIKNGRYSITEVTPDRWNPALYFDPDHSAPDKTYSKIGGWVREHHWDPMKWHLPIPPRVVDAMDESQKWAISCTREALEDYGYPERKLNGDRTAVILGNAMAGEKHYFTALRLYFPEYAYELSESAAFANLPASVREEITCQLHNRMKKRVPDVTEDTMPGELANCIAGRIANTFDFHGPNYVVDAACASAMAAFSAAVEGLVEHDFDVALTGGIDRNMGASTFIKFSKIGALSASGTRPYAEGADGFVMGEGAVLFLLKRLSDAERDGDKVYAVLRGIAGSSDGKGKGITAPNPVGQKLCIERAWENAGLSPETVTYMEGHGTSTRVGDVVETQSMVDVLSRFHMPVGSVALGSVKSNIGHLKGAAGAAGLLKTALALRDRVLPPSVRCERPNPDIDFAHSPLYVNREFHEWHVPADATRRAGVSAFGFGGTNFHVVLEEYIPHKLNGNGKRLLASAPFPETVTNEGPARVNIASQEVTSPKAPLRGVLALGAASSADLSARLLLVQQVAQRGEANALAAPAEADLRAPERLVIDYADASDLAEKCGKALKALTVDQPAMWKVLRAQGIFRGHGPAPKVAFLYTGQGSQYVNMLRPLLNVEPIVAQTFAEADRVMTPLLGKPLTDFIFVDQTDAKAVAKAEDDLRQTAITQPAVLATDEALTRLLAAYGIRPDMTMGHSLGEYGALVGSGAMPFHDALEAVSARGRGMTNVAMDDNGKMAAVFAPIGEVERILKTINGYVVIANINSNTQAVIGGASKAVDQAMEAFQKAGYDPVALPVSHAFHTSIVAGAGVPLRKELERLHLQSPRIPIIANVNGEFYPMGTNVVPQMLDILTQQVAAPVQFVKGLRKLYEAGARVFVEVGPKKALQGFAEDVLSEHGDVISLFTNHPKIGDIVAFNQALCALYAAGLGAGAGEGVHVETKKNDKSDSQGAVTMSTPNQNIPENNSRRGSYEELGHLFADVMEKGWKIYRGENGRPNRSPVVITGAALGLPGTDHIFDDGNVGRILRGDQFIDAIPTRFRRAMLDKNITRLVKSDNGGPTFESINNLADVIKLAARGKSFDPENEFGMSPDRLGALDRVTQLAIAAGIDALRDAGIPLVMRYKTTSKGTQLPERWGLPDELRDETGVIFGSAFPGLDSFEDEMTRYWADHSRREQLAMLTDVRGRVVDGNGNSVVCQELDRRIGDLQAAIDKDPYIFNRRFLLRTLSMGHSQFAEFIGARGPNTQINSACATTTQAIGLAEDWINSGRCKRVIVISADDVTSDHLLEWMGAGFLASGAAATDEVVEEAAVPFDRRRHGLIIGMGAAALVVESAEAARERGLQPICEVLSSVTANSAFHGTRLDVQHIGQVMESLIAQAESRSSISRHEIAPQTVFVSHETYTPARGGSASAEIHALRRVFGEVADRIVIANTKGFTGHAMATGIEDVVAVKALETGTVPPVANFKEVDPELGTLNLSKGGVYPIEYALHLGAGFGSQISMTLLRWVKTIDGAHRSPNALGYGYRIADPDCWNAWLQKVAEHPTAELEVVHRTLRVKDKAGVRLEVSKEKTQPTHLPELPAVVPEPRVEAPTLAAPPVPRKVEEPAQAVDAETKPIVSASGTHDRNTEGDSVKDKILSLVAAKTGYPMDMLDLDLDLEADLGVDTVKQAEVLAAVREAYGIVRDDTIKLRDFPTLAHVIRFVYDRRPDLLGLGTPIALDPKEAVTQPKQGTMVMGVSAPPPIPDHSDQSVQDRVLALVVEKTGYPPEMLDLDLDLEADLGVDTVKQAEMFAAIREIYNIPRDENRKLRDYPTLAHVIRFVFENRPDLATPTSAAPPSSASLPLKTEVPVPPQVAAATDDAIREKVLEIVAEKTGYPKEMLDLDLDLEADLGIDTVKQAEMFAAVRAAYNIPRDENLKLRDFPTLASVIQFARDRQPAVPAMAAKSSAAVTHPTSRNDSAPALRRELLTFDAANRIPRRVPVPVLRPALSICKPTGVILRRGQRVIVMPDRLGVAGILTESLARLGVEVLNLQPAADVGTLEAQIKEWLAAGPIHGIYWLPALDNEGSLHNMDLSAWHDAVRVRVKSLYATMRLLYDQISSSGTFLLSATSLGGQHGYDQGGAAAPMGGAVVGFTKAYKREKLDAVVKAIDFGDETKPNQVAEILIQETLRDPCAVEIGYKEAQRWTIGLQEHSAADGQPGLTLDKDTVFLVTGGAGSIVSAITVDLATASGGTFYLLDVVPEPDPNDPDLRRFASDKDGLKRDLFARIQARGERATPALVEKEIAALERAQAACSAINAVRAAGGTAHYFTVNLTDAAAVGEVIKKVRARSGRIDVLLHAAGVERSHFLPDKDPREFDLVFDVKSDGWFNLLHAIGDMPLGATVAFSSIAGRFGNGGQTDYSAANDLLCKITSSFRTTRPGTRGIVIDWTAWGGIGMATRGSIPKMMEAAGIDMLPPEAGVPLIRRELTEGGTRGEIVIGQRLGALMKESDVTGGLDISVMETSRDQRVKGPMLGRVTGMTVQRGLVAEVTLDPKIQPFLYDHQIDGIPVLPGVMGIEGFAESALVLLPEWHVADINDVNFLAPLKFYRNQARALNMAALLYSAEGGIVAECCLTGLRSLPGQSDPQITTHFTGRIRLTKEKPATVHKVAPTLNGSPIEANDIYRLYFHGPAYQVVERAWWDGQRMIGMFAKGLPSNHHPSDQPTYAFPRLIELCFQTAGLWEMGVQSRMGLPFHVDHIHLARSVEPTSQAYAIVTPDQDRGTFDAEVIDANGNVYLSLSGYRTVALPNAIAPERLKALQAAMTLDAVMA